MNPVFLKIGPIELHYYGLMYAIAFFVGISLGKKIAKERNFDLDLVENYAFVAIISGLLGKRTGTVRFPASQPPPCCPKAPLPWGNPMLIF